MISQITGRVVAREIDRVEVLTAAGVAYEVAIPLPTFEALPAVGRDVTLHTHLVVREDSWQLIGFSTPYERQVFRALLTAKGVGPALALGLLSALSADNLVRAIRDRDLVTLQAVPRVGRKKAEQLVLDLADKLDGLFDPDRSAGPPAAPTRRAPKTRYSAWCAWATCAAKQSAPCVEFSTAAPPLEPSPTSSAPPSRDSPSASPQLF